MRTLMLIGTIALAAGCGGTGLGKETRSDITTRVEGAKPAISTCYEAALKQDRKLRGRMVISFIAEAKTGKFTKVNIDRNDLPNPELATCVTTEFAKLKLAKPTKTNVAGTYPIEFMPEDLAAKAPPGAPPPPATP